MPIRSLKLFVTFASMAVFLAACAPDVGSEEWCEDMKEKPKSDWTISEASDFAKSCIF